MNGTTNTSDKGTGSPRCCPWTEWDAVTPDETPMQNQIDYGSRIDDEDGLAATEDGAL